MHNVDVAQVVLARAADVDVGGGGDEIGGARRSPNRSAGDSRRRGATRRRRRPCDRRRSACSVVRRSSRILPGTPAPSSVPAAAAWPARSSALRPASLDELDHRAADRQLDHAGHLPRLETSRRLPASTARDCAAAASRDPGSPAKPRSRRFGSSRRRARARGRAAPCRRPPRRTAACRRPRPPPCARGAVRRRPRASRRSAGRRVLRICASSILTRDRTIPPRPPSAARSPRRCGAGRLRSSRPCDSTLCFRPSTPRLFSWAMPAMASSISKSVASISTRLASSAISRRSISLSSTSERSRATSASVAPCSRIFASIGSATRSTSETSTTSVPTCAAIPSTRSPEAAAGWPEAAAPRPRGHCSVSGWFRSSVLRRAPEKRT